MKIFDFFKGKKIFLPKLFLMMPEALRKLVVNYHTQSVIIINFFFSILMASLSIKTSVNHEELNM